MSSRTENPQLVAERVRDGMFAEDAAARGLEMAFLAVGPGYARMSMPVRSHMLNGFKICHGGYIATLADTAFAYACNSYNEQTVASGISVDFVAPGREGDLLVAEAREIALSGRTGVYDVSVTNGKGEVIAVMRGKSYRLKGKVVVPQ